ncbi:hypothetical protein BXY85_0275 [Roseivirga pacifica]|uniref:Uncharacterized protein n=1 Tax=Roseivirga pacifica TaxID=1267423 RepID=A0A1I0RA11_9BACT|nr:hypothetical protein [Roseivirga pacifica]RKQ49286.1 hypothetical protein BXY85_0275 [Roseivirga pacifica]SEW37660.1 hypothetical protein SAMN05216290_3328 [Roseivirga pacifica]
MRHLLLIALLAVLCTACNQTIDIDPETGFEIHTIRAGAHNSITRSEPFNEIGISITVKFDNSANYALENENDQADINKLIGFSDCAAHHQRESARFGWRWFEDELQILAYVYRDGDFIFEEMGAIPLDTEVEMEIRTLNGQYLFSGEGLDNVALERSASCNTGENYWLWPYFGGNQPAPHDITIQLKRQPILQ